MLYMVVVRRAFEHTVKALVELPTVGDDPERDAEDIALGALAGNASQLVTIGTPYDVTPGDDTVLDTQLCETRSSLAKRHAASLAQEISKRCNPRTLEEALAIVRREISDDVMAAEVAYNLYMRSDARLCERE